MLRVRIERHAKGPRLHVGSVRLHHWHCGALLIAWGARLVWGDRHDLPRARFDPEIGVTTTNARGGVW